MEIKIFGKTYELPREKVCPDCGCVFIYREKDIQENWVREDAYNSNLIYTYVNCPECGNTIIIKDFRNK